MDYEVIGDAFSGAFFSLFSENRDRGEVSSVADWLYKIQLADTLCSIVICR